MPNKSQPRGGDVDHETDQFATAKEAFRRLLDADRIPEGQVEYVHIVCMANGELSWTIRPARADENEVGWVAPPF